MLSIIQKGMTVTLLETNWPWQPLIIEITNIKGNLDHMGENTFLFN